jgi:hypothetical protein
MGHRLYGAIEGYAEGIVRLIGESYGRHTVQNAWKEFNLGRCQPFHGDESNAELFYSWLFHHWTPARERGQPLRDQTLYGIAPTRAYLDRCSSYLNPRLRLYLQACLLSLPGFYEVLECDVGTGFQARAVLTGSVRNVSDAVASTSIKLGDILYAHLISIGQITLMDAISPRSFPPHTKGNVLRLCQERQAREEDGPGLRRVYLTLSANESL